MQQWKKMVKKNDQKEFILLGKTQAMCYCIGVKQNLYLYFIL